MTLARGTDAPEGANVPLTPEMERASASSALICGKTQRGSQSAESEIDRLYGSLGAVTPDNNHPRTARLLASGKRRVARKVFEEAGEVALEAVRRDCTGIVRESADLIYNLVALWYRAGIRPDDVWAEMRNRALRLGIAEKLPKERVTLRRDPKHTGGGNGTS